MYHRLPHSGEPRVSKYIGIFSEYLGLFPEYIELFSQYITARWRANGVSKYIGLF